MDWSKPMTHLQLWQGQALFRHSLKDLGFRRACFNILLGFFCQVQPGVVYVLPTRLYVRPLKATCLALEPLTYG